MRTLGGILCVGFVLGMFLLIHYLIHSAPPVDPVIHHLIQPNPPINTDSLYPTNPCYEARLLKLHLVRPDLILFPLDLRYYA